VKQVVTGDAKSAAVAVRSLLNKAGVAYVLGVLLRWSTDVRPHSKSALRLSPVTFPIALFPARSERERAPAQTGSSSTARMQGAG